MKRKASAAGLGTLKRRAADRKRIRGLPYNQKIMMRELQRRSGSAQIEYKVCDWTADTTIANTGTMSNMLVNIARGTDFRNQFVGQAINPVGLQFKYTWSVAASAVVGADGFNTCRTMIFQWLQAGVPAVNGILQDVSFNSPINVTNRENINVLWDSFTDLYLDNVATASMTNTTKGYIKGKRMLNVKFPLASTVAQYGGLYMLNITDSTIIPHPRIRLYTRITYTD